MTTKRVPKARQLSGPGVPGAETDTPLYHVDVDREQLSELIADPVKFLGRAGLGEKHGIAPGGAMSVNVARADLRWTPDGWLQVTDAEATTQWCCHVVGDTTTCYQH